MRKFLATSPHDRAERTAREIGADAAIVICDPGTDPQALPVLPARHVTVLAFDDIDYEDADQGRPFSATDARRVLETVREAKHGIVVTCPGGVSRSAAIACAIWASDLAKATDEPFGRNTANKLTCPNRLVFDTCVQTWDTQISRDWVDGMFERNMRDHLAANADANDKEPPTFTEKGTATNETVMAMMP